MKPLARILAVMIFPVGIVMAQTTWQTTHTTSWQSNGNCKLESSSIRMIVHPFHVDVEEEAVISAQGQVFSGDPSSLEITGQFQLSTGSAVRSMLLWNGKKILKAKLKDKSWADSAYENVVDRTNVAAIRHDPALIEKIGDNLYQFKIYPVAINNSRKIRILYSVPLFATDIGPRYEIKTAFTYGCDLTPATIPVEIDKADNTPYSFKISHGTTKTTLSMDAIYLLPYADFVTTVQIYNGWSYYDQTAAASIYLTPDSTSRKQAFSFRLDSSGAKGCYTAIFSPFPDTLAAMINELNLSDYTLEAAVNAGGKKFISNVPYKGCFGVYIKSDSASDCKVVWNIYNKQDGSSAVTYTEKITADTTSSYGRYLPLVWGSKYNLAEKTGSFGALFGYVDNTMSLLALERDSLKSSEAAEWQSVGVPPLLPDEIFISAADTPLVPVNNAIFEYEPVRVALKNGAALFTVRILKNNQIKLEFGKAPEGLVSVRLADLRGRAVFKMDNVRVSGNSLVLSLPGMLKGVFLIRVNYGKTICQQRIILK